MASRTPHRPSSGFSLLELVVVLGLLAIVAGLSVPRLSGFMQGQSVREEGRRMLSLLQWARGEAISRGERLVVWFDPSQSIYGARYEAPGVTGEVLKQFRLDPDLTLQVPPEEANEDGQAEILFWPDGAIDLASAARVECWEDGEPSLAIVRGETGLDYRLEDLRDAPEAT